MVDGGGRRVDQGLWDWVRVSQRIAVWGDLPLGTVFGIGLGLGTGYFDNIFMTFS